MPQTTVAMRQQQWLAEGQLADTAARRIEGAINNYINGGGSPLPFGRVLHRNAAGQAVLPSAAASAAVPILGVSVLNERFGASLASLTAMPAGNLQQAGVIAETPLGIPPRGLVEVIKQGDIVMISEEIITAADLETVGVFYRFAGGTAPSNVAGRVRKSAIANEAEALPNAKFVTTCAAVGGLVVVRLGTLAGNTAML